MVTKNYISVLTLVTCLFSAPAFAEFYLGAGFGMSHSDVDRSVGTAAFDHLVGGLGAYTMASEEGDTGKKLFAGYRMNSFFGAELGSIDLGETGFNADFSGTPRSAIQSIKGTYGAALLFIPVTQADIFLKAGMFSWERTNVGTDTLLPNASDKNSFYAIGIDSNRFSAVTVRVEYEKFKEIDMDMVSVSVMAKF